MELCSELSLRLEMILFSVQVYSVILPEIGDVIRKDVVDVIALPDLIDYLTN